MIGDPDLPGRLLRHGSTGTPASTCRCCSAAPGRFSRRSAWPTRRAEPFAVRNRNTNGELRPPGQAVPLRRHARRRRCSPSFRASGRLSRIRHSFSPVIVWNYQPAANVPEEYRAGDRRSRARPSQLRSDAHAAGRRVGLSQAFEGKDQSRNRDTTATEGAEARKIRLLSINTSGITYDFEQAKKPGLTGWATAVDLQHLSERPAARVQPQSHARPLARAGWSRHLQVRSLPPERERELRHLGKYLPVDRLDLRAGRKVVRRLGDPPARRGADVLRGRVRPARPARLVLQHHARPRSAGAAGASARISTTSSPARGRSPGCRRRGATADHQSLGFSTSFSPTPFWSLSWSSQYNITDGKFESQVVRLERELHEWRAGFNFVRNAERQFRLLLLDLPDGSAGAEVRLQPDDDRTVAVPRADGLCPEPVHPSTKPLVSRSPAAALADLAPGTRSASRPGHPSSENLYAWLVGSRSFSRSPRPAHPTIGTARASPPDVPASLSSTTLDGASRSPGATTRYTSDPGNFQNYRIYSTTYDLDNPTSAAPASSWRGPRSPRSSSSARWPTACRAASP